MGLTPDQWKAADLTARGLPRKIIASSVDVSVKTISRWRGSAEFAEVVESIKADADATAGREVEVDVRDVLKAALTAHHRDGRPDYGSQLAAARLLLQFDPPPPAGPPRETIIYRDSVEGDDGGDAG